MKKRIQPTMKNNFRRKTDLDFKLRARSIVVVVLVLFLVASLGKTAWIMVVHGDDYKEKAEESQLYDTKIEPVRGTIYDVNMNPLVTSSSAWILTADPGYLEEKFPKDRTDINKFYKYISKNLGKILGCKVSDMEYLLKDTSKNYVRLKKKVNGNQRIELEELFEKGYEYTYKSTDEKSGETTERTVTFKLKAYFSYENDNLRFYPDNNFASTIIGVTDSDGNGITGVEQYYNSVLAGESGRMVTAKDAVGNALDSSYETVFDATEGKGLVLTIDSNIQYYLENALNQALESTGAKGTYGIVMDVDSGAILAMSNKPDFDLNNPRTLVSTSAKKELKKYKKGTDEYAAKFSELLFSQWNSFCVTNNYEPGSTFKIFTAAAALEEGVADLNTTYTCTGGIKVANDTTIHCANTAGHGFQTFTQGLMNSCNPFFISIGQKLGVETYYKYFEAFGFTERTGIDLNGESYPVYHSLEKMGIVELASTSFGQSFRISPIQLITATCAIANGGKLMKPYVVDSIVDTDGSIVEKTEPTVKRQVISEQTAATVRQMMEAVVEGGTGKNAYIAGYRVAGKTATSEKLDDTENKSAYVASFVCYAPADDPKIAILVGVDEPAGVYRGGGVIAAPIAKEVMESSLKYLNVEPQYTADELASISRTTTSLVGKTVSEAKVSAGNDGFSTRVVGSGDTVVSQVPSAGQTIPQNGVIVIYTENNAETEMVKVPDFTNMTASQVNSTAVANGINVILSGPSTTSGATAFKQSISAKTEVVAGSNITVYFHSTTNMDD